MLIYRGNIELQVGTAAVAVFTIEAEIIADDTTDSDWCFGSFWVEGVVDTKSECGEAELTEIMVLVPTDHILTKMITDALVGPKHFWRIEDMWAEYLDGEREAARCNAADAKCDAIRAGMM